MQALELGIAHDEAIFGIPQNESFGNRLDRIAQAHFDRVRFLHELLLIRDVDGDADEMRPVMRTLPHAFGTRAQPDPFAFAVPDPKRMIDRIGLRSGEHFRHGGEVAVFGMNERIDVAEGEIVALRFEPEDFVHRTRPVEAAARNVPVP